MNTNAETQNTFLKVLLYDSMSTLRRVSQSMPVVAAYTHTDALLVFSSTQNPSYNSKLKQFM
jgi:hypothetical protein